MYTRGLNVTMAYNTDGADVHIGLEQNERILCVYEHLNTQAIYNSCNTYHTAI